MSQSQINDMEERMDREEIYTELCEQNGIHPDWYDHQSTEECEFHDLTVWVQVDVNNGMSSEEVQKKLIEAVKNEQFFNNDNYDYEHSCAVERKI